MERNPKFMNQKTQYCSDGNTLQVDLQIQWNPLSNPTYIIFAEIDKVALKFIWKFMGLTMAKTVFKINSKLKDTESLILKFSTNLEQSRHCGIGIKIDIQINGMKWKVQKLTLAISLLIFINHRPRVTRIHSDRVVFSVVLSN